MTCATLALGGCSNAVEATRAEVSIDGTNVAVSFASCNEVESATAEESEKQVTITATPERQTRGSAGDDCEDRVVVTLAEPLGDRMLVNGGTGAEISIDDSASEQDPVFPYASERVSQAEYEAALEDMVECLETEDPAIDAWVTQELNWKTWDFHKESDSEGNMSAPAIAICSERILEPLE